MRNAIAAALALLALGGCATGPLQGPPLTPEGECLRAGGIWHRIPAVCEYNFS